MIWSFSLGQNVPWLLPSKWVSKLNESGVVRGFIFFSCRGGAELKPLYKNWGSGELPTTGNQTETYADGPGVSGSQDPWDHWETGRGPMGGGFR